MREEWLAAVRAHVERQETGGDRQLALDPEMLNTARQLALVLGDRAADIDAWNVLGRFHWQRVRARYDEDDSSAWEADSEAAKAAFGRCFVAGADIPEWATGLAAIGAVNIAYELGEQAMASPAPAPLTALAQLWRRILAALPMDYPTRAGYLTTLSAVFVARFNCAYDPADLSAAVTIGSQAAEAADDEDLPGILVHVGDLVLRRYGLSGDPADLDAATTTYRRALLTYPADSPDRASCLSSLSFALSARFERSGEGEDLDAAIAFGTQAVELAAPGDDDRPGMLFNLGSALLLSFQQAGGDADLDAAIAAFRQAVSGTAVESPDRALGLTSLGNALRIRYERTGRPDDIDEAIMVARQAAAGVPDDHPGKVTYLSNLGAAVASRSAHTGQAADEEEATALFRQALALTAADHPTFATCVTNLGWALREKALRTGEISDLNEAIDLFRQAVNAAPGDNPRMLLSLQNLVAALLDRYRLTQNKADVNAAIAAGQRMVASVPDGHPNLAVILTNFGSALLASYEETGQDAALSEGIAVLKRAVDALPAGHPDQALVRGNLGNALRTRFEQSDDLADLDDAIALYRLAAQSAADPDQDDGTVLARLGDALLARFERTKAPEELAAAVTALRSALAAPRATPGDTAMCQSDLGKALLARFELAGDENDLSEAVSLCSQAVEATPDGHASQGTYRFNLAAALLAQSRLSQQALAAGGTATRAALIVAVAAHVEAITEADQSAALDPAAVADVRRLAALLDGDSDLDLHAWGTVGLFQWLRFLSLPAGSTEGEWDDALEAAVHAYVPLFAADEHVPERLVQAVAEAAGERALDLFDPAAPLDARQLTREVDLFRRILQAADDDEPNRPAYVGLIGVLRYLRFVAAGDQRDLTESITGLRQAVTAWPADLAAAATAFYATRCDALRMRSQLTGDPADLDEAIAAGRRALELGAGEPDLELELEGFRAVLGMALVTRAKVTGATADQEEAVAVLSRAAQAIPAGATDHGIAQAYLSDALLYRYDRAGDPADLDRAVDAAAQAVETTPSGHPNFAICTFGLGNALLAVARRTGERSALDRAVDLFRRATEGIAPGHPTYMGCLDGLGLALQARFAGGGDQADLDAAIDAGQRAVELSAPGSAVRGRLAGNLSGALLSRFAQSGSLADLDAAIDAYRAALAAAPPGHPNRAMDLSNLGAALRLRFERTEEVRYLDEAVGALRQAVAIAPDGYQYKALFQANLGMTLISRYLERADGSALDEAVAQCRQAADALPDGHADAGYCLNNLAMALLLRFEDSGRDADLTAGTEAARRAAAAAEGPPRAQYLMSLAGAYALRFERTKAAEDAAEAITRYTEAARVGSAAPAFRISAAQTGAEFAARLLPGRAAELLDDAVRLLPLTAPRQLTRSDQQHALSQFGFLACDAAALALETGGQDAAARALGLLEMGRGVLLGQALDTRSDLMELHVAQPALADRFLRLRDRLDAPEDADIMAALTGPASAASTVPGRDRAAAEFTALLDQIRGLAGFESFLLPPEPSQLSRHAGSGPIIVFNISKYRSDALLVTEQAVTQVALPDLDFTTLRAKISAFNDALDVTLSAAASRAQRGQAEDTLSRTLEWLWDVAAEPALRHLGHARAHQPGTSWPRVWWVPGGLLGLLPLHAAGYHRRGTGETVLDRVVSSYTPTIRALAWAREHTALMSPGRSLIVAMPTTPGHDGSLPNVEAEVAMLRDRLPAPTVLIEEAGRVTEHTPTRDAVLARLPGAALVHFSCHASSHPADPSQSQLYLHDYRENPFTVASLLPVRLQYAQLAFLSACQTARNAVTELLDEGIHLTSAFQLAGYPHVVGTLWTIYDDVAAAVAGAFYQGLLTGPRAFDMKLTAQALHDAVRGQRGRPGFARIPSQWAAYLHAGA